MNWEEAACLDFAANYHERMFLESWYTKSDNNNINICRDMPGAYYSLIVSGRARADSREQTRELSIQLTQVSNGKLLVSSKSKYIKRFHSSQKWSHA